MGWQAVDNVPTGPDGKQRFPWNEQEPLMGVLADRHFKVPPHNGTLYIVENEAGDQYSFWGNTVLNEKLSGLPIGTIIRIEPLGLAMSRQTNREYKNYRILVRAMDDEADPTYSEQEQQDRRISDE